jgi:hypothetical protein
MDPERWLGREFEPDCQRRDDSADDQDQERGGPVADVEAREVEPALPALRRERDQAIEQRRSAAARTGAERELAGD